MNNKKPFVILVDDHIVVRNGLKQLIEHIGGYIVGFEFDNGQKLLEAMPFAEDPALIILDMSMPVLNGEETMTRMLDLNLSYPILILTLNTSDDLIIRMYKLGIRGYLEKGCTSHQLIQAIDDIIKTGYHYNHLLSNAFLNVGNNRSQTSIRNRIIKQITPREIEFLKHVCNENEYTYEQIADRMNVGVRTIDSFRQSLFDKFDIKSKTGLVLFTFKYQIL